MFLYELSIELGLKSGELAAAATTLDLGPMGPTTKLTPEQVELLRAQAPAIAAASEPPGPPPPVGVPADWLARVAPDGPENPMAPDRGVGPPAWSAAPALSPTHDPAGAHPASGPASWLPSPPAEVGPSFVGGAPAGGLPTLGTSPALGPGDRIGPATTGAHGAGGSSRFSRVQVGLIAVVAVAVVALFGFMVANTGPDEGRRRALAVDDGPVVPACAGSDAAVCNPSSTVPGGRTDAGRPGEADGGGEDPGVSATTLPAWAPSDADAFCSGARGTTAFDLRIMAALLEEDVVRLRTVITQDADAWRRSVDALAAGAPRSAQDDVALYRSQMEGLIDAVGTSTSLADFRARFGADRARLLDAAANGMHPAISRNC
jgi:hypothetical protein